MWGENSRTIQSSSCKNHTTSLALLMNSSNWFCTNECTPAGHNYNCCSERDNEMNLVNYKLILQESYKVTDLLHKFFKLLGVAWWSSSFSPQYPKSNSMLRPKLLQANYQMCCPESNVKWINRKIILQEYNISLTHKSSNWFRTRRFLFSTNYNCCSETNMRWTSWPTKLSCKNTKLPTFFINSSNFLVWQWSSSPETLNRALMFIPARCGTWPPGYVQNHVLWK